MKTKVLYKDFQIHTVPFETFFFDHGDKYEEYILLDDVNEKRWKLNIKGFFAIKITNVDCVYIPKGYYDEYCLQDGIFRRYILEVEDSEWIKQLKKDCKKNKCGDSDMDGVRHFLLPLYDHYIEIVALDIQLEEA